MALKGQILSILYYTVFNVTPWLFALKPMKIKDEKLS
jgi:hypothetical protein